MLRGRKGRGVVIPHIHALPYLIEAYLSG